jgi:pimeloyl-ACP methyl ester carboxylesterase
MWSASATAVSFAVGLWIYTLVAADLYVHGVPLWALVAGVPLVYLAILAFFVTWYFILAWVYRARRPRDARIGVGATLRLVWYEYWTLGAAPFRMLFYRSLVRQPKARRAELPLLLVHGVLCNAGVWAHMAPRLKAAGVGPVYPISYGPPLSSIELFAEQMHARIERICRATGAAQLVVVTHSMGGLVALAYIRRYGGARIRRLVTIAGPFKGSVHARGFFGTSLAQLRPNNAWLRALDPRAPRDGPPVVSIWSWHDSMVAPQTSSILPGARNEALVGIGHNALLRDPEVLARVVREYREAAAETLGATSESPA